MSRQDENPITMLYGLFKCLPWAGLVVTLAAYPVFYWLIPQLLIHPPSGEQMMRPGVGTPLIVIVSGIGQASHMLALPITLGIFVIWLAALLNRPRRVTRVTDVDRTSPSCPECGAGMKLRTARRGSKAGKNFYGCSDYPRCKGIIDAG